MMSRSSRHTNQPALLGNWAEALLELGSRVRRQLRQRAETDHACEELNMPGGSRLALEFVCSTDQLKLRALVEDWSLGRIAQELGSAVHASPIQNQRTTKIS
jgi:hypothetical protein